MIIIPILQRREVIMPTYSCIILCFCRSGDGKRVMRGGRCTILRERTAERSQSFVAHLPVVVCSLLEHVFRLHPPMIRLIYTPYEEMRYKHVHVHCNFHDWFVSLRRSLYPNARKQEPPTTRNRGNNAHFSSEQSLDYYFN